MTIVARSRRNLHTTSLEHQISPSCCWCVNRHSCFGLQQTHLPLQPRSCHGRCGNRTEARALWRRPLQMLAHATGQQHAWSMRKNHPGACAMSAQTRKPGSLPPATLAQQHSSSSTLRCAAMLASCNCALARHHPALRATVAAHRQAVAQPAATPHALINACARCVAPVRSGGRQPACQRGCAAAQLTVP